MNRFAKDIAWGGKHTEPSILIHQANGSDGRESRRRPPPGPGRHFKLGKPVLAYVGTVAPMDAGKPWRPTPPSFTGSDPANKADGHGSAEVLREYWTREGHPGPTQWGDEEPIAWGTPGDFDRCTRQVMEHGHMTEEQAHGYCNLRHHEALGYWPAQHAEMERGK